MYATFKDQRLWPSSSSSFREYPPLALHVSTPASSGNHCLLVSELLTLGQLLQEPDDAQAQMSLLVSWEHKSSVIQLTRRIEGDSGRLARLSSPERLESQR